MKLVIVESPSKAKTIKKYLGAGYEVAASVGHIRDLPKSNKNAIDIEGGFIPTYVISPRKKEVIADLKKRAKKADEILLATDPDREGEAIAWHVKETLGLTKKDTKRIVFHEITKEAVREALEHARPIDEHLLKAQEARRVLDRIVGYDLSGLIWKKVKYGLSAGRVQSPALRILVEREREIRAFISEKYWILTAKVKNGGAPFTVQCEEEIKDATRAEEIVTHGNTAKWKIHAVEEKKMHRNPRAPFTTSTLQQSASSRLGFSPSRTMRVAQKLYEAGNITYMRTDSTALADVAQKEIIKHITAEFGKEYTAPQKYSTKSKNAQEAHEAIRPTHFNKKRAGTTDEQKKLYLLIWERTVASQMQKAELLKTKIITTTDDSKIPSFSVIGSRLLFPGWLAVDTRSRGDEVEVPKVKKDDPLSLKELNSEEKETTPPPRYSEARLVKELEKRGIGRPSTYASTIKTVIDRGYVEKEDRALRPTDIGELITEFLEEHFNEYISDSFTSRMEDELDDIAAGKSDYVGTLASFYTPFHNAVESKQDIPKITTLGDAPDEFKCPKCDSPMVIKVGTGGKFMSCGRFPDCDGARTKEGEEIKDPEPLGIDPVSGEKVYLLDGRFGPYVQLGEKTKKNKKPRRASVSKEVDTTEVTLAEALTFLSLPRILGTHPETKNDITVNIGRFGPYIAHMTKPKPDFRSLKEDDPYTITFEQALEILKEPKRHRGDTKKKR
jgi:DNA topoisomerase-1